MTKNSGCTKQNCNSDFSGQLCDECILHQEINGNKVYKLLKEIWIALTHWHLDQFFKTFEALLFHPGKTLKGYLENKSGFLVSSYLYFLISTKLYLFVIQFVFIPNKIYFGTLYSFDAINLTVLVVTISLIGSFFSDRLHFVDILRLFFYIYGTAFILNIFIIPIEYLVGFQKIKGLNQISFILVGDLPTISYITFAIWQIYMECRISRWKYYCALIIGLLLYFSVVYLLNLS